MEEQTQPPFFGDDVDGYLKSLWENKPKEFVFVSACMQRDRLKLDGHFHTDGPGSCTSTNCFGTTGCHASTTNGYCACSSPDGPCVWVPGV